MSDLTSQSETPTPTTDKITQAARETIYLCNFRVSVDGEWLCLRELNDISLTPDPEPAHEGNVGPVRAQCGPWGGLCAGSVRALGGPWGGGLGGPCQGVAVHKVPRQGPVGAVSWWISERTV